MLFTIAIAAAIDAPIVTVGPLLRPSSNLHYECSSAAAGACACACARNRTVRARDSRRARSSSRRVAVKYMRGFNRNHRPNLIRYHRDDTTSLLFLPNSHTTMTFFVKMVTERPRAFFFPSLPSQGKEWTNNDVRQRRLAISRPVKSRHRFGHGTYEENQPTN